MQIRALNWGMVAGLTGAILWALLALPGCGKRPDPTIQAIDRSNLRSMMKLYTRYIAQNRGQRPASEEEFKAFVNQIPQDDLAKMGIRDVQSVFVSERDNKPYVLRLGQPGGPPSMGPVAYEQEGKDGKRFVALATGRIEEVDEAGFKKLVPAGN